MQDIGPNEREIVQERLRKIAAFRESGIDPYPHRFDVTATAQQVREALEGTGPGESIPGSVRLAGRIRSKRTMGKVTFMDLHDPSGKIQLYFKSDRLGEDYGRLDWLDIGDFAGIQGERLRTRRGEPSIDVESFSLLGKCIRPLPSEHYGLSDVEFRRRHRTVDLIMNPEVREVFVKRTRAIAALREFLDARGYLEVETPALQPIYGGATARPFVTTLNAFDLKVYLAISPELYLKRLVGGGLERVYTICKNFRNEGADATHNPEFTMMECYAAYQDYHDMMELTEQLYAHVFERVAGSTRVAYQDVELDFAPPWRRVRMYDAVAERTGIDVERLERDEIAAAIARLPGGRKIEVAAGDTKGMLVQELFEIYCQEHFVQPTFIIDHPRESTPLCKAHRSSPELIERFEPMVYGMEIGNAYSELNDPILQRTLMNEQNRYVEEGEETLVDEDFLRAMEYGMPMMGGLGLGVDRLVMLLANVRSIRDVIFFPFMRPSEEA